MQTSAWKSGDLKGKTFECVETKQLEEIKFGDAKSDGTKPIQFETIAWEDVEE